MPKNPTQSNKPKTPKLRFPGFSCVWEEKKIGQVLKIGSGKDYKNLKKGSVPVFGTGGYMLSVDKPLYSGESVMIGRKGTIDKPFYYNGDFWTVDTLFYTYDFNGILPKFTDTIFKRINWQKYNEASGVPSLSKTTIEKIKINLPQLPEQQKIASFLGGVDAWIENLREQKKSLESYKKGLMQKIFSQQIRFKDEEGNDFPEWEEKRLGEVCEKKSSTVSANSLEENMGEYNIYGATGFLKKVDFYQEEEPFISIVKDGAGVGRILLCEAKSSVLGTLDIIKPKSKTDLYFLYLLLGRLSFLKYTTGLAIPHIYFKDYSKEKIKLPSLPEQQKIAEFLSSVDTLLESKQQQISKAEEWKKGLMQGLFV